MLLTVLRKKGSDDTRRRIIYLETSQKDLQSPHDFVHPTENRTQLSDNKPEPGTG